MRSCSSQLTLTGVSLKAPGVGASQPFSIHTPSSTHLHAECTLAFTGVGSVRALSRVIAACVNDEARTGSGCCRGRAETQLQFSASRALAGKPIFLNAVRARSGRFPIVTRQMNSKIRRRKRVIITGPAPLIPSPVLSVPSPSPLPARYSTAPATR